MTNLEAAWHEARERRSTAEKELEEVRGWKVVEVGETCYRPLVAWVFLTFFIVFRGFC